MYTNLIERAAALALMAHAEQLRKEGPLPYAVHPIAVAVIIAAHGFSEIVIAAALVHDVIEDTHVTEADVRKKLGDDVVRLVIPVTHDDTLPWEQKKKAYIASVQAASEEAKAIATADKIANAKNLLAAHTKEGNAVWRYFNAGREKKLWFEESMLSMLRDSWQHPLVDEYAALVARMKELS